MKIRALDGRFCPNARLDGRTRLLTGDVVTLTTRANYTCPMHKCILPFSEAQLNPPHCPFIVLKCTRHSGWHGDISEHLDSPSWYLVVMPKTPLVLLGCVSPLDATSLLSAIEDVPVQYISPVHQCTNTMQKPF